MLGAVGYVDNILSKNNYLDVQVENKVNSGLAEKIWLLSFVKQVRKVYKKANVFSKYFEKNKEIIHGKTTIKGTRITPDTITDYFIMKCDQEQDSEKVIQQILMD